MNQSPEHYSYRVYADPKMAQTFDQDRFGGHIGGWIKQTQERFVFSSLPLKAGWKIADIGAGTGRFTLPFLSAGGEVTACDASEEMLKVLQQKCDHRKLSVQVADAHHLPFPDRSFDCAVSFRMLLHVIDWKTALKELCRISNGWVVFDIPSQHGFLLFAPVWHKIRGIFNKNVQAYRTFRNREVKEELKRLGFEIVTIDFGFFLPIALHRLAGSVRLSKSAERLFHAASLNRIAGNPLTIIARRLQ